MFCLKIASSEMPPAQVDPLQWLSGIPDGMAIYKQDCTKALVIAVLRDPHIRG